MLKVGRLIAFAWVCWWVFFAWASGSENAGGGIIGILRNAPNAIPELVVLLILLLTWKHPKRQAIVLLVVGLVVLVGYPILVGGLDWWVMFLTELVLAGPAILAGWLLWVAHKKATRLTTEIR